ncbi:MAG: radical SAM protein, partial [Candidatus Latescibacterota bacterium]
MRLVLVNTNQLVPPIAPIGLDYVSEAVRAVGHEVALLDLCWEADWRAAVAAHLACNDAGLVGMTLRNTDDCMLAGQRSYLDEFGEMVRWVRQHTDAPVVIGGVGFSVMPTEVLARCQADWGIRGDGEFVLPLLANRLARGSDWTDLPGLVWRDGAVWRQNPPAGPDVRGLPTMRRTGVDNRRYYDQGGQIGFETHRGCPGSCTYCADPLAKGKAVRLRPPQAVADEVEALLAQGIDHLHTCDGEFNLPAEHAVEVCRELARRGLGARLRWYAYCTPSPFSVELAESMRRAGCVGINFGADSGDPGMLGRLGRDFGPEAIEDAVEACRRAGMATMVDLLLGSPGESEASLRRTIAQMQRVRPDRVGVSLGVRLYPGTALMRQVTADPARRGLIGGPEAADPLYYLEPAVADSAVDLLISLIDGDPSFFFAPAGIERDYNYSDNRLLVEAIAQGYRGA